MSLIAPALRTKGLHLLFRTSGEAEESKNHGIAAALPSKRRAFRHRGGVGSVYGAVYRSTSVLSTRL